MYFTQLHQKDLFLNTYFIGDLSTHTAAVVDPSLDIEPILELAKKGGWKITEILETHVHADFISGSHALKEALANTPRIHASGMGGEQWVPSYTDHAIHQGESLLLGRLRLEPHHTPGHTPEHLVWLVYEGERKEPSLMLTGDLLFVGSVGRPDLLGEKEGQKLAHELYKSLFERLRHFPDATPIWPAHGAGSLCGKAISSESSSTLGRERLSNPSLKPLPKDEWIKRLLADMPKAPRLFQWIKQQNLKRTTSQGPSVTLDLRDPESFAKGHLEGSLNLPYTPYFLNWASMVLEPGSSLILLLPPDLPSEPIVKALHLIGLDNLQEVKPWKPTPNLSSFALLELADLNPQTQLILDVRTPQEWHTSHIEGATHLELSALPDKLSSLPKNRPIVTVCGGGIRSSLACSLLRRAGFPSVSSLHGGMAAVH